jgi:hypothetical protein
MMTKKQHLFWALVQAFSLGLMVESFIGAAAAGNGICMGLAGFGVVLNTAAMVENAKGAARGGG